MTIEGGGVFDVSTEEVSLLRGALRAGLGFPHDCNVGGCGNCRFDLVSGEMETLWPDAPGLSDRDRKRGKRLACQSRPLGDCTIKMRPADEYIPAILPRRGEAVVTGRRDITRDIAEFSVLMPGPAPFFAGQYALLRPPGVAGWRAYSLSNQPNDEGLWHFVIRRVPGGQGSNAMFDRLAPGDTLEIDGPYGHAYFRPEVRRPVVCIAGGSGVGPIASIAGAALRTRPAHEIRVFEGARTHADLCLPKLLGSDLPGLGAYWPVLSAEPPESHWDGARGFVHEVVDRTIGDGLGDCEFYVAGPPPMIEALQDLLLLRRRVPVNRLHFDRFF